MSRLAVICTLALVGCGEVADDSPAHDAAVIADSDTGAPDVAFTLDTSPEACPSYFPGAGTPCSGTTACTFANVECGGTLTATCVGGVWQVPPGTCTATFCPQSKPETENCTGAEGRQCTYWPVSRDACEVCTCTAGKWSCSTSATCPLTFGQCTNGTACSSNSGCGQGVCANGCGCGTDGVLHCRKTLC